jgi:hypothetical protein
MRRARRAPRYPAGDCEKVATEGSGEGRFRKEVVPVIDGEDDSPDLESSSTDDGQPRAFPVGDAPTPVTPLGTTSLWMQLLRDPRRHKQALDALAVKPEGWGDYTEVAATMRRLSLAEMPVSVTIRSENVAYVRFVGSATERSASTKRTADWYLTTVRGADGLWRVWDLTEEHRPPVWRIFG